MFKRILMNAADSGSGNGAAAPSTTAAPAATTAAPAQGDAPLTRKDLESFGAGLVKTVQDGVFANLRRAGVLNEQQPSNATKPKTTDEVTTPSSTPATGSPGKLRAFDRAVTRAGLTLSEKNYDRYERMFLAENPDDAEAWVKEVLPSTGSAPPAAAAAAAQQNTTPPNGQPPQSDRGAPAAAKTPPEEINLLKASKADIAATIKAKGIRWYSERLREQLRGVNVKLG